MEQRSVAGRSAEEKQRCSGKEIAPASLPEEAGALQTCEETVFLHMSTPVRQYYIARRVKSTISCYFTEKKLFPVVRIIGVSVRQRHDLARLSPFSEDCQHASSTQSLSAK